MQTVLVIDDDRNLRDTMGIMLEREGYRPVLAEMDELVSIRHSLYSRS